MTEQKITTVTQVVRNTYWKPKFRGNDTLALTIKELVSELGFEYDGRFLVDAKDVLNVCDELMKEDEDITDLS
jgi:hypothetical protein